MAYVLENRYQDSGWERLPDERFGYLSAAFHRARLLAADAMCYGMVRVVDNCISPIHENYVIVTFPAGAGLPPTFGPAYEVYKPLLLI